MDTNYIESTTIMFKNIPKEIKDLTSLLNSLNIPAKDIKPFGRKRALITYELKSETEKALETLRNLDFAGKTVNVSWFCKDKPKENKVLANSIKKVNKCVQTINEKLTDASPTKTLELVNKYIQKLYAIEGDLGFDQPPPPYLKYNYPPINKNILDNICISLLSNKRFYTQVLHLMNRMNLEPPFGERKYKPNGVPKDVATQTDEILSKPSAQPQEIEQENESELETSGEEESYKNRHVATLQLKRKLPPNEEQYKKKARQMLQNVQKLNKESTKTPRSTNLSIKDIFDKAETSISTTTKIEFQVKQLLSTEETKKPAIKVKSLILPDDLKKQKLSQEVLQQLPIYKNYQKGNASNKLYIKNLHKDISSEDLAALYERFLPNETNIKLDVKVMQHGRMKGQAFVTFQGEQTNIIQDIVDQALDETNGFILRDKPMIVCYGKNS